MFDSNKVFNLQAKFRTNSSKVYSSKMVEFSLSNKCGVIMDNTVHLDDMEKVYKSKYMSDESICILISINPSQSLTKNTSKLLILMERIENKIRADNSNYNCKISIYATRSPYSQNFIVLSRTD